MPSASRQRRRDFQKSSMVNSNRWIVPSTARELAAGCARASARRSMARERFSRLWRGRGSGGVAFIERLSLGLDPAAELGGGRVEQDHVDGQERRGILG